MKFSIYTLLFIALVCVYCTNQTKPVINNSILGVLNTLTGKEKQVPRKVAILPFNNRTNKSEAFDIVRKSFFNKFSSLKYVDVELFHIDSLLKDNNLSTNQLYPANSGKKIDYQKIGKLLDVDGLILGEIISFERIFAVVYSQVAVGLNAKMVRVSNGKTIWQAEYTARTHEGGASLDPVSTGTGILRAALNMREIELLRAADDLSRELVKTIPRPDISPKTLMTKVDKETSEDNKRATLNSQELTDKERMPSNTSESEKKQKDTLESGHGKFTSEEIEKELQRGLDYEKNREYYDALRTYTNILPYRPKDHELHFHVGFLNYQTNKMDEAKKAIQKAISINPNQANYHYYLGLLFSETGDDEQAKISWKKVLEINPNHQNAKVLLSRF